MKRTHVVLSIALVSLTLLLAGCKGKEKASSNSSTASPAVAANANSPADSNQASATAPASEPAKLIGTYEAREVEDKGVVTMITQIKTIFVFRDDGTYSRVSQVKGKTYHSDSGQFRIEGSNMLIITIQITDKNVKSPPVIKAQRLSLSPDGDELKLTSGQKGTTATYQRIAKPKAS